MHKIRFEFMTGVNNEFMLSVNRFMDEELTGINELEKDESVDECKYIQDFIQADDKFTAANSLNNVFIRTVDEMFEHDIMTAEDDARNVIAFEICFPNNAGNEDMSLTCIARKILHRHFKGCPDYINSKVIVFSEGFADITDVNSCTECGVNIDIPTCESPLQMLSTVLNAFKEIVTCPEYLGMLSTEYIEPVNVVTELVKLRQTMKQTFLSLKAGDKEDCLKEYYNVINELKKIINVHYGETTIIKEDK